MPFDIRFDQENKILIVTVGETFTLKEFQTVMEEITRSKQYPPDTDALWDLRALDFAEIDVRYLRGILQIRKQYPARDTARLAHIVQGDFAFGMMRMYQIYSDLDQDALHQKVGVFKSISEGVEWLLSL
jgi:hypothetical protein